MRSPLVRLARVLGTQPWLMSMSGGIIWLDQRMHVLTRGRVSLVGLAGLPSVRLTTTGRRTGLPRTTNLLYFPYGVRYVITGSNWGRPAEPAWTHNLRTTPRATISLSGKEIDVIAREVTGVERDELWALLLDFWPGYEMERLAAGREFPLFLLTRAD